jgi:hypothetical protein
MKAKMIRRVYTFGFRKTRDRVVVLGGDANHYAVWPDQAEVQRELERTHGQGVQITHVQDFTEEIEVPEGGADVRVPDGGDRGGRSAADGGRGTSKRRRTGNQKS